MYHTTTIKKDFKTIPFDQCLETYRDAADMAEQTAITSLEYAHKQHVKEMEKLYNEVSEAPFEGNLDDKYSAPRLSPEKRLEIRRKAGNKAISEIFVPRYSVDKMWTWMMPQVIAHIATLAPRIKVDATGKIEGQVDGVEYIKQYFFNGNPWMEGLYRFLMIDTRGSYVQQQYKGDARNYCALVPLILYAHKLHNDLPYAAWGRKNLHYVVNDALAQAMTCEVPKLSSERVLQIRNQGLLVKTGAKAGETRKPTTTYKLYSIQETELGHLPELAQTMIAQIWCAHPENRTKYMVLDPEDWDRIPPPLINTDIFKPEPDQPLKPSKITAMANGEIAPWDL